MRYILTYIDNALKSCYAAAELESVKKALCLELLGISSVTYYSKEALTPDPERERKLETALNRLAQGEPLQYIIGSTPFCGLSFRVDSRVLIPRPETAELVEWITEDAGASGSLLDIGTGSGCIAVTLAHNLPHWKVQGWDISEGALEVARENSRLNGTDVEFNKADILNVTVTDCYFDVIVSNPPYVMESEKEQMENRVLDFEPHSALFVPDSDPLMFYRAIAEFGNRVLNKGGRLYFEINPLEAEALKEMLSDAGYHDIELRKDIFGKQRMIKAKL
jgi:protein-(glutamine-N5) methyltransferase, release factor-specific